MKRLNRVWAVSWLTFREGLRHRVLIGVGIAAAGFLAVSVPVSGFFLREIGKVQADWCLSVVTAGGLLVPFFLGIQLLARDFERRTAFALLSRAVSRTDFILGKFGGLVLLAAAVMSLLAAAAAGALLGGRAIYGRLYYQSLSWAAFFQATGAAFLEVVLLDAMVVFWSTVSTSSFVALLFSLSTYVVGQTVEDVLRFIAAKVPGVEISPVVEVTVRVVKYLVPDLAAFDLKLQASHGMVTPAADLLLLVLNALCYGTVFLCGAILVFRRKDLA
ncbi:ABC transporter permease subunit [Dissulfurirhabdus thermomarina]|uniref:ABC transporter permease subunit n=1 Tax=Dissulfurirhabdus thermomarina TaxID=1765737 RepID=A0A6N9TN94_DISTH|nr:ABC transporter permease subunit [Dissulfurirhabdus thermomarina]NDY42725.1 ABC transporter permease subunit [Dissulfurirhabdus thermomarina]NMX23637.1 ABC transporter permease subunit [Dissulfurirhabdus thermomarina]